MKVIVAGYSKTGTKTMNMVLSELGYENIYDFQEHFYYHRSHWNDIYNGADPVPIFKKIYANVDVVIDCPSYIFWREILEAFPDAKVILVERDPEKWVKSAETQINTMHKDFKFLHTKELGFETENFSA